MNGPLQSNSHRRWNPLRREWVVVSPHRTQRPWQGQTETPATPAALKYDPSCYLCPGNTRAGGHVTPQYSSTFVFDNDFAALREDGEPFDESLDPGGLLRAQSEKGICRVLCFDPRHDLTLATMPVASIRHVVDVWAEQEADLAAREDIRYVQIFENRGAMMGASNPHPHGQIWATEHIPNDPLAEAAAQAEYFSANGRVLLLDVLDAELKLGERIVAQNESWVALVPFWAVWPFELLVVPRNPAASIRALDQAGRYGLAAMLKTVCAGYNRIFDTPFPYSMGFHGAPCDGEDHPGWQLHAHFYPPLLRSATVRKFMVGFELLGSPQRDITPESAAETVRHAIGLADKEGNA
ncbi:UDP-glucose--hexose-1-phosphate uridylyltransferase [Terriglobus sp.]|uniref:UDP-glucose--hexose-1-phosphate uridylyltransferase n=1 Tax=Terriglobus sp. TaxID=1889013 RepID=UPI003AFF966B